MSSARKLFIGLIVFFSLVTPVLAAEGDSCSYKEEQNDGFYNCQGTEQEGVCKFDDGVEPACQKDTNQSGAGGTDGNTNTPVNTNNGAGESASISNWHAPEQTGYTTLNLETNAIPCAIIGMSLVPGQKCSGYNGGTLNVYNQVPGGGAIGGISNMVLAMYNPSISSTYYLADLGTHLGLIKPTYAATVGTGDSSGDAVIKPIYKLWQVARNVSYVAFILVAVAIGFMIMLRSRINPQTVVSAQAALPGLFIGFILVTFSYLIAAFIVDLSFVGMNLVVYLFQSSGISNAITSPATVGAGNSIFDLFQGFAFNGNHFTQLVDPIKSTFQQATPLFQSNIPFLGGAGGVIGSTIGFLVMVIIMIAILMQMFRLLWALVECYIAIFVTTIFGPFIILGASLPGRGGTLGLWWRSILGNVLVFPAVFAAFLFAGTFLGGTEDFSSTLPLFAGLPVGILKVIIGYGIVLGTPAIPGMVKKALKVPDIAGLPQEALKGASAGLGVGQAGYGRLIQPIAQSRQEYATGMARFRAGIIDKPPESSNRLVKFGQSGSDGGWLGRFGNLRNKATPPATATPSTRVDQAEANRRIDEATRRGQGTT